MHRTEYRLFLALALSLLLHLAPLLPPQSVSPPPNPPPALQAELRPAPAPVAAQPLLKLDPVAAHPQAAPEQAISKRPPLPPRLTSRQPSTWTQAIQQHIQKLQKSGNFYPAESIRQGQEGEALVLLIIDQNGNVAAARLEQSSGYPLLDEAALRAVRSVRSLPADAPSETLLPVRFRLR